MFVYLSCQACHISYHAHEISGLVFAEIQAQERRKGRKRDVLMHVGTAP